MARPENLCNVKSLTLRADHIVGIYAAKIKQMSLLSKKGFFDSTRFFGDVHLEFGHYKISRERDKMTSLFSLIRINFLL